jgi:BlaI family transcriptional regulator, penicillinase repressor
MPATPVLPKPTEAGLELLRVLWEGGPSTAHEIHDAAEDEKDTG